MLSPSLSAGRSRYQEEHDGQSTVGLESHEAEFKAEKESFFASFSSLIEHEKSIVMARSALPTARCGRILAAGERYLRTLHIPGDAENIGGNTDDDGVKIGTDWCAVT